MPTVLLWLFTLARAAASNGTTMPEAIAYTLRFPAPETHYVEVEAELPTSGQPAVELMMAVWTPGSYMVREFARQVEAVTAAAPDGRALAVEKVRKNRWRVETGGAPRVVVRYRLYAREMSVRTNFIDAGFALLNGAPTFLTLADDTQRAQGRSRPHEVRIEPPAGWRTVVTALPPLPGAPHAFRAASYDVLVDSPIYLGNAEVAEFEVDGKRHLVVTEGGGGLWDTGRAVADLERLVRAHAELWGFLPYERYVFFNLLTETSGGLEHRDSTVLMSSRFRTRTRDGYLDWLGLASHELFHVWNVKRLRPAELAAIDYEREVYTENLWISEGVTSYYDDLLVHRAGLASRKELLRRLGKSIATLETSPGRLVQPLAAASFDAWIKYYRRDENFVNTGVSYYTKGGIVTFLLDAEIRRTSGGARSLDDVLRLAFRRFPEERGFCQVELLALIEQVAGASLDPFFAHALHSTAELDYGPTLEWYGLRFAESDDEEKEKDGDEANGKPEDEPAAWLGADADVQGGRLVVTVVKRGTPAHEAGLNVGDEIIAIGDDRVPPEGLKDRLKAYRPGEEATLLVARRERLVRLPVTFGEKPKSRWKLEIDPDATQEQKQRLDAWLGAQP